MATTSVSPSTVTEIACSPSTNQGAALDGDQILAVLALDLGVDTVAVTTMTNLGFHRLMAEHGIRVLTTDVGDRHVLAALRASGAVLGGEQSGHVISLDGHVTGDGLAAALLLCRALNGRSLGEAAGVMRPPAAGETEHSGRPAGAVRRGPRRGGAAQRRARGPGQGPRSPLRHGAPRPRSRRGGGRAGSGGTLW